MIFLVRRVQREEVAMHFGMFIFLVDGHINRFL